MKTSAMITMAIMLTGSASAASKFDTQRLVICVENGKHAGVPEAASKATNLLLSAGVKLEWHAEAGACKDQRNAMVVSFLANTPKTFHPAALAYALPYEGVHVQAFHDRIAQADPGLAPALMANVIVHEITRLFRIVAHGGSQPSLVGQAAPNLVPFDWSHDGKQILYRAGPFNNPDLMLLHLQGDQASVPYKDTPFAETDGRFSPDGKWIAYVSNESGANEVYVQAVPITSSKIRISNGGGTQPRWSPNGGNFSIAGAMEC